MERASEAAWLLLPSVMDWRDAGGWVLVPSRTARLRRRRAGAIVAGTPSCGGNSMPLGGIRASSTRAHSYVYVYLCVYVCI